MKERDLLKMPVMTNPLQQACFRGCVECIRSLVEYHLITGKSKNVIFYTIALDISSFRCLILSLFTVSSIMIIMVIINTTMGE